MTDPGNILLKLVRSALWDTPAENLPQDIDWSKVFRLARQQTLVGLLADAVQKLPPESRPDTKSVREKRVANERAKI